MSTVYQVSHLPDDLTLEAAIAAVVTQGYGEVIRFRLTPNIPGRLPAMLHNCTGLWVYEDNTWHAVGLESGRRYAQELPR